MTEIEGLKQYINDTLGREISHLAMNIGDMNAKLRNIELTTTTRMAETQKDISALFEEIEEIKATHIKMNESQKIRWRSYEEERKQKEKEQAAKDNEQSKINDRFGIVLKLSWTMLLVLIPMAISFIWSLIVNGGTLK